MEKRQFLKTTAVYAVLLVVLALAIGVAGRLYLKAQTEQLISQRQNELQAVADLRVGQITAWRQERLSDAYHTFSNQMVARAAARVIADPSREEPRTDILKWLAGMSGTEEYESALLLDDRGVVRLSSPVGRAAARYSAKAVQEALRNRRLAMSDFHSDGADDAVHLDLLIPLLVPESASRVAGILVLRVNPNQFLYPLLQHWPSPSESGETLLVKREGDSVVFLNELRFSKGTALRLKHPLTGQLPAAMAAAGREGVVRGVDYRGVPVLAALRKVPDTPWALVAKMDLEEATAPLGRITWHFYVTVGAMLVSALSILGLIGLRRRAKYYQDLYELEREKSALAQRYDDLVRHANEIILLADEGGRIVDANEAAEKAYGRTRAELAGSNILDLCASEQRSDCEYRLRAAPGTFDPVFETEHVRQDGSRFPIEVSCGVVDVDGGRLRQYIARDITERKQAEAALRKSEALFRQLAESVPVLFWMADREGRIEYLNERHHAFSGLSPSEALMDGWRRLVHPEDLPRCLETYRLAAGEGLPFELVYRMRNAAGEYRWILDQASPRFSPDGSFSGHIGSGTDITEAKIAEDRLRDLSQAVEQSPVSVVITGVEGNIQYVNPKFSAATGYRAEEVIGKNVQVLEPGETLGETHHRLFWATIRAGGEWRGEFRTRKKNGELFWEAATVAPIRSANGTVTSYLSVSEDITERKRAAQELSDYAERLRRMVNSDAVGIIATDSEIVTDANDAFLRIMGFTREDVEAGKVRWREFIPPECLPLCESSFQQTLRGQPCPPFEIEQYRKDGSRFPTLIGPALMTSSPKPEWVTFILDLTERKRAEAALRASEEKYRRIVETSEEGIRELDANGTVVFVNAKMAEMLGYSVEEMLGASMFQFMEEEAQATARARFARRRQGAREQYEFRYRRKDGTPLWAIVCASPLYDGSGEFAGSVAMVVDLTAQKQTEQQIRALNQDLRRLSAELLRSQDEERRRIARELHDSTAQLLTGASMSLAPLRDFEPSTRHQLLGQATTLVEQASREIRSISYLLHPPLLDEMGLASALEVFTDGLSQRTGIQVSLHAGSNFGRLPRDVETTLFRVAQEALANVHRHSGSTRASLRLERSAQEVLLEVRDYGRGMPAAAPSASGTPARLGIGIPGMRERVRQLGGRLEITSDSGGTCVSVALPCNEAE